MFKIKNTILLLPLLSSMAIAETQEQEQTRFLHNSQQQWIRALEDESGDLKQNSERTDSNAPIFENRDLQNNPPLLQSMLEQALDGGAPPNLLAELTQLYSTLPQADAVLLKRAQGMDARYRGQYRQAIEIYRNLAAMQPENPRIRLDLAAMLAEDKQWREAAVLFEQVKHEPEVPQPVLDNVQTYLDGIKAQQRWMWSGGLSPNYDANINNAADPHCSVLGCSREKPQSAYGLTYSLQADKQHALSGHHGIRFQAALSGNNYYFSRYSAYDSAYARIGAGWLWQDAKQRWSVLPFYQFQLSGTDNWGSRRVQDNHTLRMHIWAHAYGLRGEYRRNIGRRWQADFAVEAYRQHYRMQEQALRYDGLYAAQNAALAWRASARDTVYGGVFANQAYPKRKVLSGSENNAAYRRYGIQAGWIHDWSLASLSTRLHGSAAYRRFKGQALNVTPEGFPLLPRRDREYQYGLAIWKRNFAPWGWLPKLNIGRQQTRSTHTWANRRSKQFFVEVERQF